jgi:valyl-tRNA synthetase
MSKSRGNTIDPLDWIDTFGADATRFTLARGSSPGGDVAVSEEWVTGARNFCNKLWNATRFALINGARVPAALPEQDGLTVADRWILSRLATVTAEVDALYERYEFGKLCEALYHFAWDEVCDWYLELAKAALPGPAGQTTRDVLGYVLDALLRLLHPVVPFVTEELWTALTGGDSVMIAPWPGQRLAAPDRSADSAVPGSASSDPTTPRSAGLDPAAPPRDPAAEAEIEALMRLVTEVRRFRSDQGLRPGQPVQGALTGIGGTILAAHEEGIRALLRLSPPGPEFAPTASLAAEGVTVELDTAGAIDVAAERRRVEKDLAAARAEAEQTQRKLANESFLAKAPSDVVAKTRFRLETAQADIARLSGRLATLAQDDG